MNRFKAFIARLLNIRYEAAYYTSSRRRIQGQPQDARLDLDKCAREQLVNLSRHWEANSALATKLGLIFEQYTVGEDGLPVSPTTSSPEFNDAALEFWLQSEPYLDIGTTQGFRAMTAVAAMVEMMSRACMVVPSLSLSAHRFRSMGARARRL